jgi:hypothetical protein
MNGAMKQAFTCLRAAPDGRCVVDTREYLTRFRCHRCEGLANAVRKEIEIGARLRPRLLPVHDMRRQRPETAKSGLLYSYQDPSTADHGT